jgi:hypothetical protein
MDRALKGLLLSTILVVGLLVGGCSRAVQVGSDTNAGTTYRLQVSNETTQSMVVSYNDGRGDAVLGTVAAGRSESFIIASPARTDISVKGAGSSRSSGPYTVTLSSGTQAMVRLR